jgi:hypothetical protein
MAENITISLSAKGLQRLERINHEKDFAFIVGEERYFCPSFVAEFLSPRVSSLRSQDITIDEFRIETADPSHQFGIFLSIGYGRDVSFSENDLTFVRSVCGTLRNSELFEATLKHEEGQISEEELRARLNFLSGIDGSYDCDISLVASHFYHFSVSDFDQLRPGVLEAILSDSNLVATNEDSVFEVVHRLASADLSYFGLLEFVRFEFLSGDCMKRAIEFISSQFEWLNFGIWSSLRNRLSLSVTPPSQPGRFRSVAPQLDSTIISTFPDIFSIFGAKTFRLLYRGSRDGFDASAFHSRCDGHPNTVTLISSTNDCIFGGFTPLTWSSRGSWVSDPSLTSFIFTIKNPHNLPARIFKQKQEVNAIYDDSSYGPLFGYGHDLSVYGQWQSPNNCHSTLGTTYTNDTGLAGNEVLTGAQYFAVKEIEVFGVV